MAIGIESIQKRAFALAEALRAALRAIPGFALHDLGPKPCAIVSFTVAGIESAAVKARLHAQGVNVSKSRPNSTLLDAQARSLPDLVRASPHYYNSEDEIARAAELIAEIAAE